jgi:hypothetical protein
VILASILPTCPDHGEGSAGILMRVPCAWVRCAAWALPSCCLASCRRPSLPQLEARQWKQQLRKALVLRKALDEGPRAASLHHEQAAASLHTVRLLPHGGSPLQPLFFHSPPHGGSLSSSILPICCFRLMEACCLHCAPSARQALVSTGFHCASFRLLCGLSEPECNSSVF